MNAPSIDTYTRRTRLRAFALWADRRASELSRKLGIPSLATPEERRAFAVECRKLVSEIG